MAAKQKPALTLVGAPTQFTSEGPKLFFVLLFQKATSTNSTLLYSSYPNVGISDLLPF